MRVRLIKARPLPVWSDPNFAEAIRQQGFDQIFSCDLASEEKNQTPARQILSIKTPALLEPGTVFDIYPDACGLAVPIPLEEGDHRYEMARLIQAQYAGLKRLGHWLKEPLKGPDWKSLYNPTADKIIHGISFAIETAGLFRNQKTGRYVLVFNGTVESKADDWHANSLATYDGRHPQYTVAHQIGNEAVKRVGREDLEFIGHSKGGGLAQMAGILNDVKVTTFNSVGLSERWIDEHYSPEDFKEKAARLFTHHRVKGDPVSQWKTNSTIRLGAAVGNIRQILEGKFTEIEVPVQGRLLKRKIGYHRIDPLVEFLATKRIGESATPWVNEKAARVLLALQDKLPSEWSLSRSSKSVPPTCDKNHPGDSG